MKNKLLYVAGPYTASPKTGTINENIAEAERVSINLIRNGFHVLTPHKNTQNYEKYEDDVITTRTWLEMDFDLLSRCDAIYMMSKWSESSGASGEFNFAYDNGTPIIFERYFPSETFGLDMYKIIMNGAAGELCRL